MTLEQLQGWVTLIKDIFTCLAAIVAAGVAFVGFRTWEQQLHWKTQYELAQRMAKAVYRVRNAFSEVRRFYTTEEEERQAIKEAIAEGNLDDKSTEFTRSQKAVYNKRWQRVREAFVELDAVALEAEAIWGPVVKEKLSPLVECATTLVVTLEIYLDKMDHPQVKFSKDVDERLIIFEGPSDHDNFFSKKITEAVNTVENFLKPHLKI